MDERDLKRQVPHAGRCLMHVVYALRQGNQIWKTYFLFYVDELFNKEVRLDLLAVYINKEKSEGLDMVDMGTVYGESVFASSRSSKSFMSLLEKWGGV